MAEQGGGLFLGPAAGLLNCLLLGSTQFLPGLEIPLLLLIEDSGEPAIGAGLFSLQLLLNPIFQLNDGIQQLVSHGNTPAINSIMFNKV